MKVDFEPLDAAIEMSLAGGADAAEVFFERELGLTVKVFKEHVEKFSSSDARGIGLRVYVGDRPGRAYTSDLSRQSIEGAVESALASARVSPEDSLRALPDTGLFPPGALEGKLLGDDLGIWGEDLGAVPAGEKIEFALSMERLARERDVRVTGVETAAYSESTVQVLLASSLGFRSGYRSSTCYGYLMAIAEDAGDSQTGFGFTAGRSFGELNAVEASQEAATRAIDVLGARQVETAKVPVLFDNLSTAELIALLGVALNGEAVVKGRSFMAGRLGEKIASDVVDLVDDSLLERGFGTAPFDAEGVATSSKKPVEGGVLAAFLHNCYTARRAGTMSTGNADRSSYRSSVGVGHTNLLLNPGSATPEELRSEMKTGFEVLEIQGAHAGLNPVTGEVSVGAKGRWIDKGRRAHAVREVTIAGTMEEILGGVVGIGNDFRLTPLMGSVGTPSILVSGLVVGGK